MPPITNEDKIILDKTTFKALAVESRVTLLKLLTEKQYTLTELADLLEMQPSSVKEHLDMLVAAGLVQQLDEGRKWKYYKLTWKGKRVVQPAEIKVYLAFAVSLLAFVGSGILLLQKLVMQFTAKSETLQTMAANKEAIAQQAAQEAIADTTTAVQTTQATTSSAGYYLYLVIAVFVVSVIALGICVWYWMKKRKGRRRST